MKKILATILAIMMMGGTLVSAMAETEEQPVESIPEEAAVVTAEEPAAEEPAEAPAEAPAAEDPAEAPAQTEEAPAQAEEAPAQAEEETAQAVETTSPAEETPAQPEEVTVAEGAAAEEVTAEEETAETEPEGFAGSLKASLKNEGTIRAGDQVVLIATVSGANMEYSIQWQRMLKVDPNPNDGKEETWKEVSNNTTYTFEATEHAAEYYYRAVLTAADGTEIISGQISISVEPAQEEIDAVPEETEGESADTTEAEADEANTEETAEEVTAEAEITEEEAAEEEVAEEETTEETVEEETAEEETAEETVEEEIAEEETVEETVEEELAVEKTAVETVEEEIGEEIIEEEITEEIIEEEITEEETEDFDDYETALGIDQAVTLYAVDVTDVRLEADGLSAIFATLDKGTAVTAVGQVGSWTRVVVGDQVGFIYSDSLSDVLPEENESAEADPATVKIAEEKEEAEVEKKVTIFSSRRTVMTEGEYVMLSSIIEGFEGLDVIYQWECDQGDGFRNVENANGDTYIFRASAETLSWDWRLTVYYR